MRRLVVIDGKSVFYRGYYAMGALSRSDGTPTGGVYGFAAIAMELVKRFTPDKVVVAWDKAGTSTAQRTAIYQDYKAGRRKPPEDFFVQIPLLRELIEALGWYFCEIDGYEADDIIGTLAREVQEGESDLGSCAKGKSGGFSTTSSRTARNALRVPPATDCSPSSPSSKNRDFLSIAREPKSDSRGDVWEMFIISSDLDMLQVVSERVKMVRLVKGFTELQEIDVKAIEEKYGIKKEQFLDLKALKGDASDNIPGVPGIGEKGAVKLLNQFGSLTGVYENLGKITGATRKKLEEGRESALMSYRLAKIMTDAPVLLEKIPEFEFDPERAREALEKLEFRSLVKKFLSQKDSKDADARLQSTVLVETRSSSGPIDSFVKEVPELLAFDIKEEMGRNEKVRERVLSGEEFYDLGQGRFLLNPLERKTESGQGELVLASRAEMEEEYRRQRAEYEKLPKLYRVLTELDLPMIPVLYKIERKGMKIDRGYFRTLEKEYEAVVRELARKIQEMVGVEFNVNSPIQLSEVLFGKLGLSAKGIKKTSRGYSTGAKELEKLKGEHPVIEKILEYREAAKLLNTYIVPLPMLADRRGRVHTTFTQNVTATGRLSSLNPNLQNIPTRTEEGKKIRAGFVAEEGKVLVSADYAQFELRLAAELAGDEQLIQDFNSGIDIHQKTAAEVYKIPMEEVTKEQRRFAKVVNFGIIYGMSAKGLSEAAGMELSEAREFIMHYMEVRKPIGEKMKEYLAQAREKGYVETYFGRRRPTPDVRSANFLVRAGAERAAQNMPIQGTEADLVKKAMIRLDQKLPEGAEMVMQVHDSIMVEVAPEKAEEVARVMREAMEGVAPEFRVKLKVDVKTGQRWSEV